MINALHIKNIGIIDDICINFNNGFNVLTGETGAGKTLTIDALNILAGGRFSKEIIRTGTDHCFVEMSIYNGQDIVVSREIFLNGRNVCKINGRLVTVNELKTFMQDIIDIHAQHDNQSLFNQEKHILYLDDFAQEELEDKKEEYNILFEEYKELNRKIKENYGDDREKQRKLDLLKYQLEEIKLANLKIGEDIELEEQRKLILNSEKISESLNSADENLSINCIDSISSVIKSLEKIESLDEKYMQTASDLKNVYYELQELSRDILEYRSEIEFDEQTRNEVEQRLDIIYSLKRKYGNSIQEILNYKQQIEEEISKIENLDEYINVLKKELNNIESKMKNICMQMNTARNKFAKILEEKINNELVDLEMKNAKFIIDVTYEDGMYDENGSNQVKFLIITNKGEEAKELIKIASGGEISRIMLAIKTVLVAVDKIPVLVFDEIDTGISGKAANSVADKMKHISNNHQVICVTHLAPIAAKADYNYYISKKVEDNTTKTDIKLLSEQEVLVELARISSGNISEIAIEYAKELRKCKSA